MGIPWSYVVQIRDWQLKHIWNPWNLLNTSFWLLRISCLWTGGHQLWSQLQSYPQWPVLHPGNFQWRMLSQFSFSGWWCSSVRAPVASCVAGTPAWGEGGWVREEVGEAPSLAGGGELLTLDAKGLVDLKEESWCLWLCHLRNSWIKLGSTFSSSADILTLS